MQFDNLSSLKELPVVGNVFQVCKADGVKETVNRTPNISDACLNHIESCIHNKKQTVVDLSNFLAPLNLPGWCANHVIKVPGHYLRPIKPYAGMGLYVGPGQMRVVPGPDPIYCFTWSYVTGRRRSAASSALVLVYGGKDLLQLPVFSTLLQAFNENTPNNNEFMHFDANEAPKDWQGNPHRIKSGLPFWTLADVERSYYDAEDAASKRLERIRMMKLNEQIVRRAEERQAPGRISHYAQLMAAQGGRQRR